MDSSDENLSPYKIENLPPSVYYIPEFLTEAEEASIIQHVNNAPKPKWTCLSNRRLQNWGGLPHEKGMIPEPLPKWLDDVGRKIASYGVFEDKIPNHVLVNEYLPGQGIMPHEDGPLYFPCVSNVTVGSHGVLDFYKPLNKSGDAASEEKTSLSDRYMGSMLLQRRSLFIMTDAMYQVYMHGIEERGEDSIGDNIVNLDRCEGVKHGDTLSRGTRISLTIRYVPKVLKAKLFFGAKR